MNITAEQATEKIDYIIKESFETADFCWYTQITCINSLLGFVEATTTFSKPTPSQPLPIHTAKIHFIIRPSIINEEKFTINYRVGEKKLEHKLGKDGIKFHLNFIKNQIECKKLESERNSFNFMSNVELRHEIGGIINENSEITTKTI